jgi:hypothetical protein
MTVRTALPVLALLAAGDAWAAPDPERNFVAVVIGLSAYNNLPDEVELDFARSDAAQVRKALKDNWTEVFLLTDGEATKENIKETLRTKVAQLTGPNDVFLLYFAGHAIGADLGVPVFLTSDSTMENGQDDGLELQQFATDLQTWVKAGTSIIVTDAIHRNQLDGIYFYGPAASQWPAMPKNWMVVSSSQPESPAKDGAFGKVFADAMAGGADADRDGKLTAAEVNDYLSRYMAAVGQIPVAHGDFDPKMIVATNVKAPEGTPMMNPGEAEPVYPDTEIWSAKFVFREGDAQSVQCREMPLEACSPSCYVRTFKAGPCELQAVIDGTAMKGRVIALWPGKYDCGRKAGDLVCAPPKVDVSKPEGR